jgi:DNA polymerase
MFVGEGPGRGEDEQGRPFVGAAGRVLDGLLVEAGLSREDIYITNVVKSHPTDQRRGPNRAPRPDEAAACHHWLTQQVAILRPRVIVTLGAHALAAFDPVAKLSVVHGRPFQREGRTILPLYHPAVAFHGMARETLRADARAIRTLLARPGARP